MVFVPHPTVVKVEMVHTLNSQVVENVYHVDLGATPTVSLMTTLAGVLKTWEGGTGKALRTNVSQLDIIRITSLVAANAPGIEETTGLPIAGTVGTSDPHPGNVTLAVTGITALRGRSYRGRIFHIGLAEGDTYGNSMVGARLTAILNGYEALRAALVAAGTPMGVFSRMSGGAYRGTGVFTEITAFRSDGFVDSQRRRLAKRGK